MILHTQAMRKRVKIVLAVVFLAAVGLVVRQARHEREPVYQGKRLREWAWEYRFPGMSSQAVARDAIRSIGTNAIPPLLAMLRKKDAAIHSWGIALWQRSVMRARWLPYWIRSPNWVSHAAEAQNWVAASGFEALGDMARPAVPELIQIFEQRISDDSVFATAMALAGIGPGASNAIPVFLRAATNGDEGTRRGAVMALGEMQVEPRIAVPALSNALSDTDAFVRSVAAKGLGSRGAQAREAAPALVPLLKNTNMFVRGNATWALTQIDPVTAAGAGVNTNLPRK